MRVRARTLLPLGGAFAIMPVVYLLLPRAVAIQDNVGDHSGWSPTAADILAQVGEGPGPFNDKRHVAFAHAFQERFRSHHLAIGAKFVNDGNIRLKCGAMVPRWDMASVALELKKEAEYIFGGSYDIDIYETYVADLHKIGELRKGTDGKLKIDFTVEYPYEPIRFPGTFPTPVFRHTAPPPGASLPQR